MAAAPVGIVSSPKGGKALGIKVIKDDNMEVESLNQRKAQRTEQRKAAVAKSTCKCRHREREP